MFSSHAFLYTDISALSHALSLDFQIQVHFQASQRTYAHYLSSFTQQHIVAFMVRAFLSAAASYNESLIFSMKTARA